MFRISLNILNLVQLGSEGCALDIGLKQEA